MSIKEDKNILIEYMTNSEIFVSDNEEELEKFFVFLDDLEKKAETDLVYFTLLADAYMLIGHTAKAKDAFKKVYNPKNKKDIKRLMSYDSAPIKPIIRPSKRANELPYFKYVDKHMLRNKFIMSEGCTCSLCNKVSVALYVGTAYTVSSQKTVYINQEKKFCAECISSGTAAKELNLKFNSPMIEDCVSFDEEKRDELLHRTPECSDGFDFNEDIWPDCCGDFCRYVGNENTYEEIYHFKCINCGKEITWVKET